MHASNTLADHYPVLSLASWAMYNACPLIGPKSATRL